MRPINIATKSLLVAALALCLAGQSWAQVRQGPVVRAPYGAGCRQARPTFNYRVGVPIRWVNVPTYGYGYGYGNGYGYGYNYPAAYQGYGYGYNNCNRGYSQRRYRSQRNCGNNYQPHFRRIR